MSATSTNELEGLRRKVNPVGIRVEIVSLNLYRYRCTVHLDINILLSPTDALIY
jgi:hypothetical protein